MSRSDRLSLSIRGLVCLVVALGFVLLVAPPCLQAQGTGKKLLAPQVLIDPLDGHRFEVGVLPSTNSMGGFDSDGCSYASGAQPRRYAVATSPTTLYSARLSAWGEGITEKNRRQLLAMLLEVGQEVDTAARLAPYQRYELAARVAEVLGAGRLPVADLYLHGAWTLRDSIVGFLPGVQGAADAWEKLAELLVLAEPLTEARPRTIALFDMARLSHRGGFVHERSHFLASLDDFEDAGLGARTKRTEFLRLVQEENRLLAQAREAYLEGASRPEVGAEERVYYRYLAADLARRLGDIETAERELAPLALDKAASVEVKGLIADVRAVLRVQAKDPRAAVTGAKQE
ncbi:MAG: hypothetical protein VX498_11830 [Myxococcota bacterium]|nr:hypothetical protein [Myxococcota bacterium]